ncbi:MAG: DUF177 domain-containing protein [Oscillospiraceae bacterium]
MYIELKQVFEIVGEQSTIDHTIDLSDYELYNSKPFITPIIIHGKVSNKAGIVYFDYSTVFTMELSCDRCLSMFKREFSFSFERILVSNLNTDNDEYILVEDFKLDLDELVLSDILLNLPTKLLCKSDCKGLCVKCGINKNQNSCQCKETEIDPRLQILSQLLK